MTDQTTDPLAEIQALVDEWDHGPSDKALLGRRKSVAALRAALAVVRERLSEVEVREEWGVRDREGRVKPMPSESWARYIEGVNADLRAVRRSVTTTRHESDWEAVE